ncbi:MAG: hypothetical protein HYY86_02840 [Candidatus Harrisonbacteria bacterium]|nr:hypothetical protein [Candidatus Harrisonbacteria bacterium]
MENQPDNKGVLTEMVIDAIARVLVFVAKDLNHYQNSEHGSLSKIKKSKKYDPKTTQKL